MTISQIDRSSCTSIFYSNVKRQESPLEGYNQIVHQAAGSNKLSINRVLKEELENESIIANLPQTLQTQTGKEDALPWEILRLQKDLAKIILILDQSPTLLDILHYEINVPGHRTTQRSIQIAPEKYSSLTKSTSSETKANIRSIKSLGVFFPRKSPASSNVLSSSRKSLRGLRRSELTRLSTSRIVF